MQETQDNPLALQIKEAQIEEPDAVALHNAFAPFFNEAEQWRRKAEAITVTSADDKRQMSEARQTRLALKEIRVNVEKARKKLKEESLRKGKAIDGMANVIKFLIVPLEEHLQQQEDFVKIQEEKKKQARKEERERELAALDADPTFYNLAEMSESDYAKLLESTQLAHSQRKEAEERAERERIEREKAEAEERERIRLENERLKKEAEERQAALDAERKERERVEAEMRAKRAAEEMARREQEEKQRQAQLAPDKEKLKQLADVIAGIETPEVSSSEAKAIVQQAVTMLSKASQYVRTQSLSI